MKAYISLAFAAAAAMVVLVPQTAAAACHGYYEVKIVNQTGHKIDVTLNDNPLSAVVSTGGSYTPDAKPIQTPSGNAVPIKTVAVKWHKNEWSSLSLPDPYTVSGDDLKVDCGTTGTNVFNHWKIIITRTKIYPQANN